MARGPSGAGSRTTVAARSDQCPDAARHRRASDRDRTLEVLFDARTFAGGSSPSTYGVTSRSIDAQSGIDGFQMREPLEQRPAAA